jgi:hypothetical protein
MPWEGHGTGMVFLTYFVVKVQRELSTLKILVLLVGVGVLKGILNKWHLGCGLGSSDYGCWEDGNEWGI